MQDTRSDAVQAYCCTHIYTAALLQFLSSRDQIILQYSAP